MLFSFLKGSLEPICISACALIFTAVCQYCCASLASEISILPHVGGGLLPGPDSRLCLHVLVWGGPNDSILLIPIWQRGHTSATSNRRLS